MNITQLPSVIGVIGEVEDLITCLFDVVLIVLNALELLVAALTGNDEAAAAAANAICNAARDCAGLPPIEE